MAEAHPVGFRWVVKAKERGAKVFHVDPRYSRTSQLADRHVAIRAGTDIAFLGGLIRHVIETDSWFKEYVLAYTNAATLVHEDFRDTEDLDGLFSGYDEEKGSYAQDTWAYASASDDEEDGSPGAIGGPTSGREDGHAESERAAGHEYGSGGPPLEHAEVLRDETLQDP